ncbi:carboxypeptidase regulatory-like domain-containing protein [Olleya sp. HaHaR_3_96]|uniref:carboxypeptidase regulatory-like domain-containing protein n=1 Tax=Olleya sp. HaHaR_3_96 TaxID=2745560 RepID=UPI001C4E8DE4|nr:carboxypeptidase regulatory-like domain-containing protein [Olleya sp. HaHaR_3_96]QXP61455.1 carboxypeptidase regulatory-like domain-containing protein [Olleya sp. HaHaR_3_96]
MKNSTPFLFYFKMLKPFFSASVKSLFLLCFLNLGMTYGQNKSTALNKDPNVKIAPVKYSDEEIHEDSKVDSFEGFFGGLSKLQSDATARTVTSVDLNGTGAGVDNSVAAIVGFIYRTVSIDNTVTTTSGTLNSATITFSSDPSGTPSGAPDPNDRVWLYDSSGASLGSVTINAAFGPYVSPGYGTNSFTIQTSGNGVYNITETNGATILVANFEDFLYNFAYAHTGGVVTDGTRYMIVSVTDANNTLSATSEINLVNPPAAVDDVNTILANATVPVSGDLLSNDTDATTGDVLTITEIYGFTTTVDATYATTYGFLTAQSDGSYDYIADNNNIAVRGLGNGASITDVISYTVTDLNGNVDFGYLTITINGVDELPVATDNLNTVAVNTAITASGNVIFDDDGFGVDIGDRPLAQLIWEAEYVDDAPINGTSRLINGVNVSFVTSDPGAVGTAENQTVNYGTNGGHSGYLYFNSNPSVNPAQDNTLIINFDSPVANLFFTISDIDYSQGTSWQDLMRVTSSLDGANVSYVSRANGSVVTVGSDTFYGTGSVPANDAHGNVSFYFDTPVDQIILDYNYGPQVTDADPSNQIAGLTDLNWQDSAVPRVGEVYGNIADVGVSIPTAYGFIVLNGDGTYTYTLDTSNPDVINLLVGDTLTDVIPYTLIDSVDNTGNKDTANLTMTINGSATDSDMDGVVDANDLDDDNDGILDVNELECSAGFVDLNQTFTNNSTGTNGGTGTATLSNLYPFSGADVVTAVYEVQGNANWSSGVRSLTGTAGISGAYINTQPENTDFPSGDVGVYTYTFSEPVYNVEFKFGGLDNQDRADFLAANSGVNTSVFLSDINLGANGTFTGQNVVSSAGGSNAPNNAIQVSIPGPVTEVTITVGKQDGNVGNVTMQFYELEYCIGLDTDADGIPDYLDLDSDNDGCFDAIEGGDNILLANVNTDGTLDGTVDSVTGVPNNVDVNNGQTVGGAADNTIFDSFNQCDQDGDGVVDANDACSGYDDSVDIDGDLVPDSCDLDNDNDGILDSNEGKCNTLEQSGSWTISGTTASYTFTNGIIANVTTTNSAGFLEDNFTNQAFWSEDLANDVSLENSYVWGTTLTVNYVDSLGNPIKVTNPIIHLDRLGGTEAGIQNGAIVTLLNGSTWNALSGTSDFSTTSTTASDSGIGTTADAGHIQDSTQDDSDGTAAGTLQINGEISTFTIEFVQGGLFGTSTDSIELILAACQSLDTDTDGTPDYLDNDSDGDGCFDAIEGGDDILLANVNSDGTLDGTVDPVTGVFNNVDVNNGQTVGGAADNTIFDSFNQCDQDGDGVIDANDVCNGFDDSYDVDGDLVPDGCDLDDDNDGILDDNELRCDQPAVANPDPAEANNPGGGIYQDQLYIFNWSNTVFDNGIDNNDFQVFNLPNGLTITATFSNVNNTSTFLPSDLQTWSGALVGRELYNTTLLEEAFYGADTVDATLTVTFTALKNGVAYPLDIVAIDAESTNNGTEYIEFNTDGEDWTALEAFAGGGVWTGVGTQTIRATDTEQSGGNTIYYSRNSSVIDIDINSGGRQGFAFGIFLTCDTDNDGTPNYLDLDSDNDGCFDAFEGGDTINETSIDTNGQLTGTVDSTTGVPNNVDVNTGQTVGSSTNAAFNACTVGTVSGTILDENGDPVSGIVVTLNDGNAGTVDPTATTDASGNYVFTNVPVGEYTVEQTTPANTTVVDGDTTDDGDTVVNTDTTDSSIPVTVTAGEVDADNNFENSPAPGSVSGTILDDNGDPVSGIVVTLDDGDAGTVDPTATTDASGNYIFTNVPVGEYTVEQTTPANTTVVDGDTTDDGDTVVNTDTTDSSIPVTVTAGEVDADNNFENSPAPGSVSGTILDENGDPVSGIVVTLDDGDAGTVDPTATTDASGNYVFTNVPVGEYTVEQTTPANTTVVDGDTTDDGDTVVNTDTTDSSIPVTVTAGEVDADNNFENSPAPGSVSGTIVDENGDPVSGIVVTLNDGDAGTVDPTATTDASGNYIFTNVPVGEYTVEQTTPANTTVVDGDTTDDGDTVVNTDTTDSSIPVTVTAGEVDADNNFENSPAPGSVSGTILDENGDPVSGIVVTLNDGDAGTVDPTATTDASGNYIFTNVPVGEYTVEQTTPANTTVVDGDTTDDGDTVANTDTTDSSIPVTVTAGEVDADNNFENSPAPGSVSGTILDENGDPVSGIVVTLDDGDAGTVDPTATTDASGNYIFTNVPVGEYTVEQTTPANTTVVDGDTTDDGDTVVNTDTTDSSIPVTVTAGEVDADNNFENSPAPGSVSGTILDDNGDPVSGIVVTLDDGDAGTVDPTATTDASGNYVFTNVPVGEYTVEQTTPANTTVVDGDTTDDGDTVANTDTTDSSIPVTVTAGEVDADNNFENSPAPGSVSGTIVDENGDPVSGIVVTLNDGDAGTVDPTATTDASGNYIFTNVPVGEYTVEQTTPANTTVVDGDTTDDGDTVVNTDTTDSSIPVTVTAGEVDADNNFENSPAPGSVSGTILDENGDPVSGIVVTLNDGDAGTVDPTATTDASGNYIFTNVPVGEYTVEQTTPANTTVVDGDTTDDGDTVANTDTTDSSIPVTVTAGEVDADNNFENSPAPGSVSGTILDENGDPVSGIVVTLDDGDAGTVDPTATTDASGNYIFTNVPVGEYTVEQTTPANTTVVDGDTTDDGDTVVNTDTTDSSIPVTVTAGEVDADNNFENSPAPGSVSGTILDDNGDPVSGIVVTLDDGDAGTVDPTATTDASGNYVFTNVPVGEYTVEQTTPANTTVVDGDTTDDGDTVANTDTTDSSIPVTVTAGEVDADNNFENSPAPGSVSGTILDDNGDPVSGIVVTLNDGDAGTVDPTATTDASGNYVFTNVPVGEYTVEQTTPANTTVVDGDTTDDGDTVANTDTTDSSIPVTVTAGEVDADNNFENSPAPGSVSGTILDDNGDPVSGIVLTLNDGDAGTVDPTATTDASGNYVFTNVPVGEYTVEQTTPANTTVVDGDTTDDGDTVVNTDTTDSSIPVTVTAGEVDADNNFENSPAPGSVSGTILDENGDPVSGIVVTLNDGDAGTVDPTATTDASGNYVFTNVPVGEYTVEQTTPANTTVVDGDTTDDGDTVVNTDTTDSSIPVTVTAGEVDADNNFENSPAPGSVSGTILDDNGDPVSGIVVTLDDGDAGTVDPTATTDASGNYVFTNVPVGEYTVEQTTPANTTVVDGDTTDDGDTVVNTDTTDSSIPVTVTAGEVDADNNFENSPAPGSVSGTILDDNGDPVSGIVVTLNDGDAGTVDPTATTDASGNYIFTNVPVGEYTVEQTTPANTTVVDGDTTDDGDTVVNTDTTDSSIPVTVTAGEVDADNNFENSPAPGSVSGTILDDNGDPVSGIVLTLNDGDAGTVDPTATTDASGNYVFTNVPVGEYTVEQTTPANTTVVDGDTTDDGDTVANTDTTDSSIPVTVTAGEVDADNNFENSPAPGSVSGTILDDNGDPVSGIVLTLNDGDAGTVDPTATTDASGNYVFTNVPVGEYTVEQTTPANTTVVDGDTTDDGDTVANTDTTDSSIPVTVTAGEVDADNNFENSPAPGSVSGTILDENGDPVSGIVVTLDDGDAGTVDPTATTDASGNYIFTNVSVGEYTVEQTTPANTTVVDGDTTDDGDTVVNTDTTDSSIPVTVTAGEVDADNNFENSPAPGSVSGTILDDNGDPVSGIVVTLNDGDAGTVDPTATTDASGNYIFTNVPVGEYTVEQTTPANTTVVDGDTTDDGDTVVNTDTTDSSIPVTVTAGEVDADNNFENSPAPGSVSGTILDDNGDPVSGIVVTLDDGDAGTVDPTATTDASGNYVFTNVPVGEYTVEQTTPANTTVVDGDTTDDGDTVVNTDTTDSSIPVTVTAGEVDADNNFENSPAPGSVSGTILDDNGDPVSGIVVTLNDGDAGTVDPTATTDASGNYVFTNVPVGEYTVEQTTPANTTVVDGDTTDDGDTVANTDTTDSSIPVTVTAGEVDADNNFENSPAPGSVSGTILDDNGDPVSGIVLTLNDGDAGTVDPTATTDASGNYVFTNVPVGEYTVEQTTPANTTVVDGDTTDDGDTVANTDTTDSSIPVTVTAGEVDADNNFENSPAPGSVSGTILDENGDPVSGIVVTLDDGDAGTVDPTATTDASGNYIFTNVSVGEYTVEQTTPANTTVVDGDTTDDGDTVVNTDTTDSSIPVTVTAGEVDADNNFENSPAPGSVSGTILDDNGDPVSGIVVTLNDGDAGTVDPTATTDASGNYIFTNVPVGEYTVEQTTPANTTVVDGDTTDDGDTVANTDTTDSSIPVTVTAGEVDADNNFENSPAPGSVSGTILDDNGDPVSGIVVTLNDGDAGTVDPTATTDASGNYIFTNVPVGEYTVEQTTPANTTVVDGDTTDDGDTVVNTDTTDSSIPVTVTAGEVDADNNFENSPVVGTVTGTVDITDASVPGDTLDVVVTDNDLNIDSAVIETIDVVVVNDVTGESEIVTLTETGADTGVFTGTVDTVFGTTGGTDNDGTINTQTGDTVTVTYDDVLDADGNDPVAVTDTDIVGAGATGTVDITDTSVPGDTLDVVVTDNDLNIDSAVVETIDVVVVNDVTGESEIVTLTETGADTGVFTGTVDTVFGTTGGTDNDGTINTQTGDTVTVTYDDVLDADGNDPVAVTDTDIVGDTDTDGDGVIDSVEILNGTDPNNACDYNVADITEVITATTDCDNDGLTDAEEINGPDGDPTTDDGTDPTESDTDGDGVLDGTEVANGTDPNNACDYNVADITEVITATTDCDNDGLTDAEEINGPDGDPTTDDGTDPTESDTDGDGVLDGTEVANGTDPNNACDYNVADITEVITATTDCDNDGLTDAEEINGPDGDPTTDDGTDPTESDTDGDGVLDGTEVANGTDPNNACDYNVADITEVITATTDCDNDGLTDAEEINGPDGDPTTDDGTDPTESDTDGDGVLDGTEVANGTDPNNACDYNVADITEVITATTDCDNDGLTDAEEINGPDGDPTTDDGTDPTEPDTDGDGVLDGTEILNGTDPNNACDYNVADITEVITATTDCDNDGLTDAEEINGPDGDPTTDDGTDPTNPDSDGDGVSDGTEVLVDNTDPNNVCDFVVGSITLPQDALFLTLDCDGDGVTNGQEIIDGTDPINACDYTVGSQDETMVSLTWEALDCDGDGVINSTELDDNTNPLDPCEFILSSTTVPQSVEWLEGDCDSDNVPNGEEFPLGDTDEDGTPNWLDADDDNDGVDTINEDYADTDVSDGDVDPTGDNDPTNDDTDGDSIPDYLDTDDDNDGVLTSDEYPDPNDNGIGFGDDAVDSDGDGLPDYLDVNNASSSEDDLEIFNAVTPNGDGDNDVFVIRNIELYPENTVKIYNRWGVVVYETSGYGSNGNYFDGRSNGRVNVQEDELLPVGTYFYIIEYTAGTDTKSRAGYLYIQR